MKNTRVYVNANGIKGIPCKPSNTEYQFIFVRRVHSIKNTNISRKFLAMQIIKESLGLQRIASHGKFSVVIDQNRNLVAEKYILEWKLNNWEIKKKLQEILNFV